MNKKKKSLSFCCSESFQSMIHKKENIKLCLKCKESVIDYTEQKFIDNTNFCGNFNINQLEYIRRTYKTSNYSKPIALLALLGLVATDLNAKNLNKFDNLSEIVSQKNVTSIIGKIVNNETNEILAHVEISATLKGEVIHSTTSDINGNFKIEINSDKYKLTDILIHFDFVGFKSNTININPLPKDLKIRMEVKIPEISEMLIFATGRIGNFECLHEKENDSIINSIEWVDEEEDIIIDDK